MAAHIRNSDYEKASHAKVISRSRYATMECLVEGFMTLTTDESRNSMFFFTLFIYKLLIEKHFNSSNFKGPS